jgi:hypothetical protein
VFLPDEFLERSRTHSRRERLARSAAREQRVGVALVARRSALWHVSL